MEDHMMKRSYEEDHHVEVKFKCPLEPSPEIPVVELIGWVRDEHERPCPILAAIKKKHDAYVSSMEAEEYSDYLEMLGFKNRCFIGRVQDARATASSSKQKRLDEYVQSMKAALAASDKLEMLGIEHRWRIDRLKDQRATMAELKKKQHNEYVKSMDAALAASDYMEMLKLEQQWRIDRVEDERAIVNLNAKIKQLCAYDYAQIYDYDYFREYLLNENDESSQTSFEMECLDEQLILEYSEGATSTTYTPNEDEAIGYFPDDEDLYA